MPNPEWTPDKFLAVQQAIKISREGVTTLLRAPTVTGGKKLVAIKVNSEDASRDGKKAKIEWAWSPEEDLDIDQQPIKSTQYGGISEGLKANEAPLAALLRGTSLEIASHANNSHGNNEALIQELIQLFERITYFPLPIEPFMMLQILTRENDEGQREYAPRGLFKAHAGLIDLTRSQYDILHDLGLVIDLENILQGNSTNRMRPLFAHLVKRYREMYNRTHV